MTAQEAFLSETQMRLNRMFSASKAGYKMPAMERHRLEGFMQAGVFLGLTSNEELTILMEQVHFSVFGMSINERKASKPTQWQDERMDYSRYESPTYERV